MSNTPVVSVIMSVYNAEKFLAEALESIINQTFDSFEFIIIDDGSSDGSRLILEAYSRQDNRLKLVSRENRGLTASLNEGILLAKGTFIARMDADDIALPYRLEHQLQWLEKTGADICGSWMKIFGGNDKRVIKFAQTDRAIKMALMFYSPFAHPSIMVKADLIKALLYNEAYQVAQDYDLWERAAEAGWKMTNVPEVLLLYRVHATQITSRTANRQQELSQSIRRRYWEFVFDAMQLSRNLIDETLKIFELPLSEINMDAVDASFTGLLQQNHEESRKVIFDHATRFYYKSAASCPDIVTRWGKLNREFGNGWGAATKLKLWLFRVLQIRTDSRLFRLLKKLYIWKASW